MAGGMKVLVLVVMVVMVEVEGQDDFYNNYAFTKVMSQCLGEAVYRDYLQKVAQARQQCGGGTLDGTNLFPPSLFSGTFSAVPFQARRPQPPRGVLVQQPGIIHNQISQPGILVHPLGLPQPGIVQQQQQPPVLPVGTGQPLGTFQHQQPGVIPQQPNVFQQPPAPFSPSPVLHNNQRNIFSQQQPNVFNQQSGSFSHSDGVFTNVPGLISTDLASFPSTTPDPPLTTPNVVIDVDPLNFNSPIAPRVPNIRQRRALVLGAREVNEARRKMEALIGNLTCVLTTLAVVDEGLNVNHGALSANIVNLPLHPALKHDLLASLQYCRDMTACLPVERLGSPVAPQVQRLMAFVKCEKETRLSACLKHDLRRALGRADPRVPPAAADDTERLLSYLVGAESASELELI